MDTLEICMLDSMRKVDDGLHCAAWTTRRMELVTDTLGGGDPRRMTLENGKIRLAAGQSSRCRLPKRPHNAVAIASLSSMNLYTYLKRYLPDDENSRVAVFAVTGWRQRFRWR